MSRPERLLLPREHFDAMVQHARTELPNECCGLLAGVRDGELLRVHVRHPLVNEAGSPIEYRSEPKSMLHAVRAMRAAGHEIMAIYHSHPTSAPSPSATDLERHYSSDVVHFIIGLEGAEPIVRGWWLTETTFEEAAWDIVAA